MKICQQETPGYECRKSAMRLTRLLSVILDDDARASDDLSGSSIPVDLAKADPLSESFWVTNLDEVDLVLGAESLNELGVLGLGAGLVQDAEMGLSLVEGFGALSESSSQSVVDLHDQNSRLSIL